ncbi:MAG TPA: hypothetical protein VFM10_04880 [Terriglobales bacterium]|nr:hypothetical protein [Terriglobales bacterium]
MRFQISTVYIPIFLIVFSSKYPGSPTLTWIFLPRLIRARPELAAD